MSKIVNLIVTERQWEELKGLMGTINQGPISFGDTFFPPLKCMIQSLRLERVANSDTYHVEIHLGAPEALENQECLLMSRWPNWVERSVVESPESAGLDDQDTPRPRRHPSSALAHLFL